LLGSNFGLRLASFTALGGENIASVNPDFDANDPKGRMSLSLTIVNIRTQSLQRNFSFHFFLCAGNFCTAEPPTNNDLDALCIRTHRLLYSLFHRTAERDTFLQLFCNTTPNERRIQFRLTDLNDIHSHTALLRLGF